MNPCIAMDYIECCLKIKTKSGTVVPFRLNDAQRKLYAVAKRQQDAGKPCGSSFSRPGSSAFPR